MAKKDYSALVANVMQQASQENVVAVSSQTVVSNVSSDVVKKKKLVEVDEKKVKKDKVFTAVIDEELLNKMRYIAKSNNLPFKSVIEASFKKSILSFEEKNGVIKLSKVENSSVDDLF